MKKLLVLAALVTTMTVSVASAKEFNDARWQWFYSNSDYTGKVDLNTLSYDPDPILQRHGRYGYGPQESKI